MIILKTKETAIVVHILTKIDLDANGAKISIWGWNPYDGTLIEHEFQYDNEKLAAAAYDYVLGEFHYQKKKRNLVLNIDATAIKEYLELDKYNKDVIEEFTSMMDELKKDKEDFLKKIQ